MFDEIKLPSRWSEWKIVELLGSGSFGTVYKAERKFQGTIEAIAIKIIEIPNSQAEEMTFLNEMHNTETIQSYLRGMVDDYLKEVLTMNMLKHNDHIVAIRDYEIEENTEGIGWTIYIVMEYLRSLPNYRMNNELTEETVIKIGVDICMALSVCEAAGIIHRDIKPDNVFINEAGEFKLGDFGIARNLDATAGTMSVKGSFSYMAPEVYNGHRYDSRVDIYSLGIMLYRLMNDQREPFVDQEKQIVNYQDRKIALQKRMDGEILPPPQKASKSFAKVILKACSYRPGSRYKNAEEFRVALQELLNEADKNKKAAARRRRVAIWGCVFVAILWVAVLTFSRLRPRRLSDYPGAIIEENLSERYASFITDEGLYGVVDTMDDDKVIINPQYKQIYRGWKDQFIVYNTKELYGVIDADGKVIIPEDNEAFPVGPSGYDGSRYYLELAEYSEDDRYLVVSPSDYYLLEKDNLFGFADSNGNIIVDCNYKNIRPVTVTHYKEDEDSLHDAIYYGTDIRSSTDLMGLVLYDRYDCSSVVGYVDVREGWTKEFNLGWEMFEDDLGPDPGRITVGLSEYGFDVQASSDDNVVFGVLDSNGNMMFHTKKGEIISYDGHGFIIFDEEMRADRYLDKNGDVIFEEIPFDSISWDGHGFLLADYEKMDDDNNQEGFVRSCYYDEQGKLVVKEGPYHIEWDGHGYVLSYRGNEDRGSEYLDESGKSLIEEGKYSSIKWDGYGFVVQSLESQGARNGYLDSEGNVIIEPQYYHRLDRLPVSGYFVIRSIDYESSVSEPEESYALLDDMGNDLTDYIYNRVVEKDGVIYLYLKDGGIDIYSPQMRQFV